jgi:serralysin
MALPTTEQIIAGLVYPNSNWAAPITYSIPNGPTSWPGYSSGDEPFASTVYALNTTQAARFAAAIGEWDKLIAPTIVQTDDDAATGKIRVLFSSHSNLANLWGHARPPGANDNGSAPKNGDIFINTSNATDNFAAGSFEYLATMHELGHALGLKHPHDAPLIPTGYDNTRYTVMSYVDTTTYKLEWYINNNGSLTYNHIRNEPTTPMVLDIFAIQSIYGADPTTAIEATAYVFDQETPIFRTIYDAGGMDTIDLSIFTRSSDVDLTPGAYSSVGIYTLAQQVIDTAVRFPNYSTSFISNEINKPTTYTGSSNLGIAQNTLIENVVGGSGSDSILGNTANNYLQGGVGSDYIRGMDGNDVIDGGSGNDDVNGNQGIDFVYGMADADTVRGGQGNDSVFGGDGNDPHVNGNLGDDVVHGDAGNDTVYGGQGNDSVYGDDGADRLSGDLGNDILFGGAGADTFVFLPGGGQDWIADFNFAAGDRLAVQSGVTAYWGAASGFLTVSYGTDWIGFSGISAGQSPNEWVVYV